MSRMQKCAAYFIGDEIVIKVEVYGRGDLYED